MKKFTCVEDIGDLRVAVAEAMEIKRDRFAFTGLGRNRTLLMIFFNSSLRTRLSTQKAALNLGMNVMVLDVNQGAWKLETERGAILLEKHSCVRLGLSPLFIFRCWVV